MEIINTIELKHPLSVRVHTFGLVIGERGEKEVALAHKTLLKISWPSLAVTAIKCGGRGPGVNSAQRSGPF